ncbi:PspC domain-containing protein [Methanofollis aquaemaris]|uniref:PspC domain-containing protein n=1 Tax=Methanofollis aquaemaris TaxID=126734 RepID=A0A8A3S6K5_9EURY|nr:PspC domain-containing protein [Methanofollis aquaemaris]QSZ67489.1 PspC domain-containing protein [Methanofollis aquaemaris]
MAEKKLFRPKEGRMIAGVCAGIGKYFNVDPTWVRIVWAIVSLLGYIIPGVLIYIIAAIIIPEEEEGVLDAEYVVREEREA